MTAAETRPRTKRVRTPTLIQMEATECGAASLGIVLSHYGRHVPLEELRQTCGVSRDGSSASSVVKAARKYGLTAKGRQCDIAGLAELQLPSILYWRFEHFLVLEGLSRKKVWLNDPALGQRAVPWEEFERSYTGIAIEPAPGPEFRREGRAFSLLAAMGRRWRNLGSVIPQTILLGLLIALVGIALPALARVFVDRVLLGGDAGASAGLVSALVVATVMTFVASLLQQRLLTRAETAVALGSASRLFRHMLKLPLGFFNQRLSADLARRVRTNDQVADIFTRRLAATAVDLALVLAYGVLLCGYDLVLGLCAMVFSGLNVAVLRFLSSMRTAAVAGLQAERGRLFSTVYTTISMIETMKASGQEDLSFQQFAARQAAVTTGQQKAGIPSAVFAVVPALLAAVNTAVLLVLGSGLVVTGALTVGLLVAMQGLVTAMNRPISNLSAISAQVQEIGVDLKRLEDVEHYPAETRPRSAAVLAPLEGHVVLDKVTFGYNPLLPPLLKDFSLDLPPGSRVALVGGSGSGKSTVGRLLAGLYQPWSGRITIDGREPGELDHDLWAATMAMVDQDKVMFEGSVRDNITLWDPTIGDDEIVAALQDACIHREVAGRPGGLAGAVHEGGRNFSGGQRQRLEIARALVRRPRLLILDEATSALDTETERIIDANLRRRGATCLIIAHRLSTVRDCDQIIVLDHGTEAERGTHDELVSLDGAYAGLIRHSAQEGAV
ncbi:NHLM bacteriocin system ABC transporter, peptidase/ATP-binding protein [Amycolatopsis xylanica]|uniref:NHLM bacteriocin system ABC transporter, peptidase/ATP-binding protein n=1 Tax=Amycolatopsis xylanica TaxID=589385 RepID=A0A1H3PKR3_9PSEU|nr:NHLP family bacteriocin export ABC transporter peptidase/permease/ATPase subunit [Amycolatopsis xylanica]SDZ01435.1 NHLM bacteriocin system ABC transporter, peptidase/ATP-binding protein [Amycolatopsis xylanica]